MAKLKKEVLVEKIRKHFGESPSDEELEILEDVSDSFEDSGDSEDWHARYNELDKTWRKKYADRFSGKDMKEDGDFYEDSEEKQVKIEDLFN